MSNARGHYGPGPGPYVGADASAERSITPWLVGGVGLAVIGLTLLGARAQKTRLSPHEKEVRAWKAEFPELPWYMDQVKDARQLDMWERARDHWEKTH